MTSDPPRAPGPPDADDNPFPDPSPGSLVDAGRRQVGPDMTVGPIGYGCWRLVDEDLANTRARPE